MIKNDYDRVLDTEHGRRVLFDILDRCKLYSTNFNRDPVEMALHEGARNVGLEILNECINPRSYVQILKENMGTDDERPSNDD